MLGNIYFFTIFYTQCLSVLLTVRLIVESPDLTNTIIKLILVYIVSDEIMHLYAVADDSKLEIFFILCGGGHVALALIVLKQHHTNSYFFLDLVTKMLEWKYFFIGTFQYWVVSTNTQSYCPTDLRLETQTQVQKLDPLPSHFFYYTSIQCPVSSVYST